MKDLNLTKKVLQDLKDHATKEYPKESCGLVIKQGKKQQYIPCRNTSDSPLEEFRISPEDMADAEDEGDIIAIVHSHPDWTATPSNFDLAAIERFYSQSLELDPDSSMIPWVIVSVPDYDVTITYPKGETPLLSRTFVHGLQDCWQVCNDYYKRKYGLVFPEYKREDGWWEDKDGPSHYEDLFESAGFIRIDLSDIRPDDLLVMEIGRTEHPNHAAIYLGRDVDIPGESFDYHRGDYPFILHHLYGKPSEVIVYGGQWENRTRFALRHKTLFRE